jgi:hypothetical protein
MPLFDRLGGTLDAASWELQEKNRAGIINLLTLPPACRSGSSFRAPCMLPLPVSQAAACAKMAGPRVVRFVGHRARRGARNRLRAGKLE